MDNSSETSQTQTKQPTTPCSRCPHRLADLHTHQSPPLSPTTEELQKMIPNNNSDDKDNSSNTAVESQADEDFISRPPPEYPETTAEPSHPPDYESHHQHPTMLGEDCDEYNELGSNDDSEEEYQSANEYHSDEEGLLRDSAGSEYETADDDETSQHSEEKLASKYEGRPFYYTCDCGRDHGFVPEGEEIEWGIEWDDEFDSEDFLQHADERLRNLIAQRGKGIQLHCEKCLKLQIRGYFRDLEAVSEPGRPLLYTCHCGLDHGPEILPIESSSEVDGREILVRGEGILKLCDICEEIQTLNEAADFDNPRLQELHNLREEALVVQRSGINPDELRDFAEEFDEELTISESEQVADKATVARPLSPMVEEEENES